MRKLLAALPLLWLATVAPHPPFPPPPPPAAPDAASPAVPAPEPVAARGAGHAQRHAEPVERDLGLPDLALRAPADPAPADRADRLDHPDHPEPARADPRHAGRDPAAAHGR